ncbi:MAG: hypothetical protein ABSA67_12125 [Candidatus Brocadiia bacterium]|jgi:hypothetical protein
MDSIHVLKGRSMSIAKLMIAATAAGCLFAAGCVVRERPVYYAAPPPPPPPGPVAAPPPEVVAGEAPPAPVVEEMPPAPVEIVDPFWIAGWWAWEGRWVWHRGYWAHRPHRGAVWVPHAWVRGPHGWVLAPGHWR